MIEKKAVIEIGETSGAYIWKGTAVHLNNNPTNIKMIPNSHSRKE